MRLRLRVTVRGRGRVGVGFELARGYDGVTHSEGGVVECGGEVEHLVGIAIASERVRGEGWGWGWGQV